MGGKRSETRTSQQTSPLPLSLAAPDPKPVLQTVGGSEDRPLIDLSDSPPAPARCLLNTQATPTHVLPTSSLLQLATVSNNTTNAINSTTTTNSTNSTITKKKRPWRPRVA